MALLQVLMLTLLVGCKPSKLPCVDSRVKLNQKEGKIQMSAKLKFFLKSNPSPTVMLRTPEGNNNVTKTEQFRGSDLYFLIEQELVANGFQVVDRALVGNKIKNNVDIIIDVVDYLPVTYSVYKANRSEGFDRKGEYGLGHEIKLSGGVLYSKIILVSSNTVEGTFELHFTPCTTGCIVSHTFYEICGIKEIKRRSKKVKYTTSTNGFAYGQKISLVNQVIQHLVKFRPLAKGLTAPSR